MTEFTRTRGEVLLRSKLGAIHTRPAMYMQRNSEARALDNAPYVWPVRCYNIFPHYLINGTIFGKTLLNIKGLF